MKKAILTLGKKVLRKVGITRWDDIEYFDSAWKGRIEKMATFLRPNESICDLGCGQMWLRDYLRGNKYIPVDYRKRDEDTIVADFNRYEFPSVQVGVAFVSGALEYVSDYDWFVGRIADFSNRCVLSYCTLEKHADIFHRKRLAWKNHLRRAEVIDLFSSHGMNLVASDSYAGNEIFVFEKGS